MRGSWILNKDCNTLTSPAPLDIAVCRSCSPDPQPEARGLSFLLAFSTTSCHQRVSKLNRGSRGSLLLGDGFLYHISLQLTDFLSLPSYIIVQSPTQSLELSGNNCHAVHKSLSSGASVYESTMGFYLVPFFQPSPPTRFLLITAIGMCHFLPVHHFGMACLAGSKVNIQQLAVKLLAFTLVPCILRHHILTVT